MKEFSSLRTLLLIGAGAASIALPANAAPMLTAENGMTVYAFDKDVVGAPTCYDACAKKWPPYLTESGKKRGGGWATVTSQRRLGAMDVPQQAPLLLCRRQERGR